MNSSMPGQIPAPDTVVVWQASLSELGRWPSLAAPDEEARAARFRHPRDGERFLLCRSLLRRLLGNALQRDPRALRFCYSATGKPHLEEGEPAFNISHSAEQVLFAVAARGHVGVDIEYSHRDLALEALLEQLASADRAAIESLPLSQRRRRFFECWTRYEALVKARDAGLALPLDSLAELQQGFFVAPLDVGSGYVASVAVEGDGAWRVLHKRVAQR